MSVETATYISQLNPAYPAAGDPKSEGDDHMRLTKQVLQNQFPNLGANPVTATAAELAHVSGATSNLQTQINTKAPIASPTFTGTPAAPTQSATDNTTALATTAMVQSAILASSGVTAQLPAQSGNAGKFLTTNGSVASWAQAGFGVGGQTVTGNLTLTSTSGAAINVTPSSAGLYVTLPDATTCGKANNLFAIYNAGDYDYGVKDSTGTQLGWVRPKSGAMIGLSDSSTAAGTWAYYGLEKQGITAKYVTSPTLAGQTSGGLKRITLDANRTCLLFGGTDVYAIVYDASTLTWGTAALVRSGVSGGGGGYIGVLSATNQVLVVSSNTTTALEAVTLTISGTTVTVNSGTKGTATLAGNFSMFGQLIAVGSSFVFVYGRATAVIGLRAVSISGTTPTIGAEDTGAGTYSSVVPALFASGTVVRACGNNGAANFQCYPLTVSGSTLTGGTAAQVATGGAVNSRQFQNGNGNIVAHYVNGGNHVAVIFKLTGTTEAASSVNLGAAPTNVTQFAELLPISASKTVFCYGASANFLNAQILTDTAGTASVGTELGILGTGLTFTSGVGAIGVSGTTASFFTIGSSDFSAFQLDCSGASPTLISSAKSQVTTGTYNSDYTATRNANKLIVGSNFISGQYLVTPQGPQVITNRALPSNLQAIGAANNETWGGATIGGGTAGAQIVRVEAAA